jgi:hypothetical protein
MIFPKPTPDVIEVSGTTRHGQAWKVLARYDRDSATYTLHP